MSPLYYSTESLELVEGKSLFDYADSMNVRVPTSCGRSGECHECIVEVKRGLDALTPLEDSEEFLRGNYRLACRARVKDTSADIEFAVLRRQPRILTESISRDITLEPMAVRQGQDVYVGGKRVDAYRGQMYGLAIDAGTTTVILNLVDLESGETIHTASFENPQKFGGSDIMHRISYDGGAYKGELQQVMLSSINFEIGEMSRLLHFHRRRIYDVVLVGNTTMRDILFGVDVQSIGERPYKSLTELAVEDGKRNTTAINVTAKKLGLRVFPQANIYSGPLIGCHVGTDVAADLLAIGMDETDETVMLVDVGTNTEVIVGNRHRLMAASCPAGPAFEGGEVAYGMPGYEGAVETVEIVDGKTRYTTIGGVQPQGICGSGLVDLLAELRRTGAMNQLGVFGNGSDHFYFVPENGMSVSRSDVSALAQAKSANYCGQRIVLRHYGVPLGGISKLYLAGGFANYVDVANAIRIGFIADVPQERVSKVGNAALEGATIMLRSTRMRRVIENLVGQIEHVELETTPDFFDIFVDGCMFDPMDAVL